MVRKYNGNDLLKVLIYFQIIPDTDISLFNIVCPFHDDINPSMRIDLSDGNFFCFGCGKSGNAYDFVHYAKPELNDLECCIELERILHSKKVENIKTNFKRVRRKNNKVALSEAKAYYYGLLSTDWNKIETKEQKAVLDYMNKRGFTAKDLNIAHCRMNYNIAYPFIFPILDNGEFRGWVGRTMSRFVESKRKYYYNEGFRKRDTLCGTYEKNCVPVICEGYMDYLSIRTRGKCKNVVALLGWHMSDEQYKKMKDKGINTVISFLDNDDCGNKGTKYLERFFNVVRVPYPVGIKDAGEMTEMQIKQMLRKARKEVLCLETKK